jgi:hypothetical protein
VRVVADRLIPEGTSSWITASSRNLKSAVLGSPPGESEPRTRRYTAGQCGNRSHYEGAPQ